MTMSYLHKRLTLIFSRKIQAGKNSFLKSLHFINQHLLICFIGVYRSICNRSYLLVRAMNIAKIVVFFSFSFFFFACLLAQQAHTARNFKAYTFVCVNVRTLELLTQVLWLLKFLQNKCCCFHLHVRSATD